MAAHSEFSASSAKRLLACPGSFKLSKPAQQGARKSSIYSAEGTLAHSIAEAILSGQGHIAAAGNVEHADGFDITVTEDMLEHVQVYVDFVEELRADGYVTKLEQRVSPNAIFHPEPAPIDLFGTADCLAFHMQKRHLVVGDLKFGRGVTVEAEDNEQFLYYALGALYENPKLQTRVDSVTVTVIQPRAGHAEGPVRSATYPTVDVLMWGENVLKPGVLAALKDDAPLAPGKHCKFCPALGTCPEIHKQALVAAKALFQPSPLMPPVPATLSDWELADTVSKLDMLEAWGQAVRQEAYDRLVNGKEVPGYKLVDKRAIRKWADGVNERDVVVAAGNAAGVFEDDLYTRKLKSPAQLEKLLGRTAAKELRPFIVQKSSGTVMVPVDDPRPAVQGRPQPAEVFAALPAPTL